MSIERHSLGDDAPWEIATDKLLARDYIQCKKCAEYKFVRDTLKTAWVKSEFGVVGRTSQAKTAIVELGVLTRFMLGHLVCASVWMEGQQR